MTTVMELTAIILTYNERIHIQRCLECALRVANEVIVVDCGSTDGTQELARQTGARVLHHEWVNHAYQLNWALDNGGRGIIFMRCGGTLRNDCRSFATYLDSQRINCELNAIALFTIFLKNFTQNEMFSG